MTRTALFVFSIVHYYREMMPVACHFRDRGWHLRIIIGWSGTSADAASRNCAAAGLELVPIDTAFLIAGEHEAVVPSETAATALAPAGSIPLLRRLMMMADSVRRIARLKSYARRRIDEISPDIVFAGPYHSPDLLHNGIALACRERCIPYCCLPASAYVGARNSILARFSNRKLGMQIGIIDADYDPLNALIARIYPRWTARRDGKTIFMWDPTLMLAARFSGTLSRDPWQKPSDAFDVVYLYSDFSRAMLRDSGYDDAKLIVCGIPLLDGPRRGLRDPAYRQAMWRDLKLGDAADFVLFNVEPSVEHRYAGAEDHWRRFRGLMAVMQRLTLPVVLSLHPLCRLEDYEFAEAEYGVTIARNYKIFDLYPYCRMAVSFVCSTNVVAGEFGKSLVVYDFFGMTSEDSPRKDLFRLPNARYGYDIGEVERLVAAVLSASPARGTADAASVPGACDIVFADATRRIRHVPSERAGALPAEPAVRPTHTTSL